MNKFLLLSIVSIIFVSSTYAVYAAAPISGPAPSPAPSTTTPKRVVPPGTLPTQNPNSGNAVAPLQYTPLEPLPFTYGAQSKLGNPSDFPTLVNGFFKLILAFGVVFAVLVLVFYGISYMTSEIGGKKAQAKRRIQAALLGLLLLLGAYIILNKINPGLVTISLSLPTVGSNTTSTANQKTTCNEYGVTTICNDGNNTYIEQQIALNQKCYWVERQGTVCPPENPVDLKSLAMGELEADRQECQLAYHGGFGQSDDPTQNCSQWNKKFTSPTTIQYNACIAVPDPNGGLNLYGSNSNSMQWWVCGYNQ